MNTDSENKVEMKLVMRDQSNDATESVHSNEQELATQLNANDAQTLAKYDWKKHVKDKSKKFDKRKLTPNTRAELRKVRQQVKAERKRVKQEKAERKFKKKEQMIKNNEIVDEVIVKKKLTKEERQELKECRKKQKEDKIKKKKEKLQKRLNNMSPNSRNRYDERRQIIEERREMKKKMTKEELAEYKTKQKEIGKKKKEERLLKKAQKQIERLKKLTPKRASKFQERTAARQAKYDKKKGMTKEEKKEVKLQKKKTKQMTKEERRQRKERYTYLKQNWTTNIPNNVDLLIVDGNNLRGGGPHRNSRDDVIEHVHKVITKKYHNFKNAKVIVMFDHAPSKYNPIDGIEVQFSGNVIADDVIVKLVRQHGSSESLVITCDRELALRIMDLKGKPMRNKSFTSICPGFTMKHY